MKGKNMLLYAFLTAVLSIFVTVATWPLRGFLLEGTPLEQTSMTYLTFLGWATYFLFGAAPKPAAKAFFSIFLGILGGILMYAASFWGFWPNVDLAFTLPVAFGVAVAVFPMCYIEKVKWAGNVAASFVGAAAFFSLIAAGVFLKDGSPAPASVLEYAQVGGAELFYILIGFIAGYLTIKLSNFCANLGSKKTAAV